MSIELSKLQLVGAEVPCDFAAPYKWNLELNVIGSHVLKERGVVEISFIFGCNPQSSDDDFEMESIEAECSTLRQGRNAMTIEHDAPDFEKHMSRFYEAANTVCPIQIVFKYGPEDDETARQTFLSVGIPVLLTLKPSINLEEVEVIAAGMVERNVIMTKYRKNPIEIKWCDSSATSGGPGAMEEPVTKKARVEVEDKAE